MKALHILKIVLKDTVMSREKEYIEEAIKELKEMQNRSCGNCKYFTSSPNTNKYDCCEKGIADTSISFCCNKWEVRDESIRDTKFN